MLTLPGYRITEELPARGAVARHRGLRHADGVIVEILAAAAGSADAARLANEHAVATRLQGDSIVRVHACEHHGGKVVLVRSASGARPLAEMLAGGPLPPAAALRIAAATAHALDSLHRQHTVHLGIAPDNLLVSSDGQQVRLTGLGHATALGAAGAVRNGTAPHGAYPAYMAPEQTGRTSADIGPASDLYALGIVLFQALTGELPFCVADPLEWFHCHIARTPAALQSLAPTLPEAIAAIIDKLLAKVPEERYRSAAGLAWDLLDCARRLETHAGWDDFRPGARDSAPTLAIPAHLYGREHDREILFADCRQAIDGRAALLLVAGPAGIGKSTLVQEMQPLFGHGGGHFVFGKFDERNRGTPYSSLIQALQELVRQVLAEPDAQLAYWRDKLQAALGANGRLVVDVIRQAELVLGPQPALPDLPPAETKVRFQRGLHDFIIAFAEAGRPLAIFLDDLQWADTASLELLQHILSDCDARHLLVVGAYRDNEVDAAHPLQVALKQMSDAGIPMNTLALAPLDTTAVAALVAATLHTPGAEELGRLIADKTDGNPLFVRQFLLNLRDQDLLAYDGAAACWRWDVARIAAAELADNVADLMARRLRRLAPGALRALQIAACLGSRFSRATVATVARCDAASVATDLAAAAREGLISELGDAGRYRFCHDRIQQVTYASLGDAERRTLHLAAGRALLDEFVPDAETVFDIANQFLHSLAEIADGGERLRLAAVFAQAGGRAKAAAATDSSCAYLKAGAELAGEALWQAEPALAMQLFSDLAECEFLSGRMEVAEPMFARILERAREPADIARLYVLRMHLHMSRNRADGAVAAACESLRRLGIALAPRPTKAALLAELGRIGLALAGRRIEDLTDLPPMTDPRQQAIMSIYMNLTVAAYFVNRDLLALVAMRMVSLSIRHGNTGASAYAYVTFGMVIGGGFGRYREGFRFGELGRRVGAAAGDPRYQGLSLAMCGIFTGAWGQPLATSLEQLRRAYRYLLDCGNLMMANYAAIATVFASDGKGDPLATVAAEAHRYLEFVHKIRFDNSAHYFISTLRKIACLRGETIAPGSLAGADYDETHHLATLRASTERTALAWHLVNRLQVAYLFGNHAAAKANADELDTLADASLAQLYVPRQMFYAALTELALAGGKTAGARRAHLRRAGRLRRRLARLATNAPANFRHLELLVAAEHAALTADAGTAMRLYEQALRCAAENGCNQDWALANERCAAFFLARGLDGAAGPYLRDACNGYRQWGAEALAQMLERRHSRILAPSATTDTMSLDMAAVIKAAQAISGEIEFAGLRRRLMESLAAHAGAARVALILKRDSGLLVEDEWRAGDDTAGSAPQPFDQRSDLAHTVVQYAARTLSDVVIDDANRDHAFAGDAWLAAGGQKSLLCLPIVRHGALLGLIYMENPLLRGAFHPQRLRILHVLAGQLAISIENAGLYERLRRALESLEVANRGLEDKVAERTRELSDEIAERKRIEEALREATAAAEAANRAKSAFLANMSHEIRTPMNAIIGLSQLTLRTELTPRQSGYVKKIAGAAEMLLGIINDILDMAKIEAGKLQLENIDFALDDVLNRVADTMEMAAHEKGLEFIIQRGREIPCQLIGDPLRLGQVLLNLTSNAVKFTARGEVALSAERVRYEEEAGELVLRFAVRDTGIGLGAEQLARLFQPFSQADTSTTRTHGGTGLGLSIVKQLVEHMGGNVDVESAPNAGSTFAFTARFGVAPPQRGTPVQAPDYSLLRVLVVDDNESARLALRQVLETAGCLVATAADGEAALRALRGAAAEAAPFRLVLMDWNMPGMDGIETACRIKSDPSIPAQPVVVMVTAFSREEVAQKATRENARIDGYLMKPVKPGVLYRTIAGIFDLAMPPAAAAAPDRSATIAAHLAGRRILVVEDNEYNQLVARELLAGAGLAVTVAGNGRAGVDAVLNAETPYDLVLMDIQMPVMDGWAATRELRQHDEGRLLPIVGMTAYTMAEDIARCHEAGMDEVITKPVRIDKVLEVLAAHLRPRARRTMAAPAHAIATAAPATAPQLLNRQAALDRLAGSQDLLLRLACDFVRNEATAAAVLERHVAADAIETAERHAHSTRGTAMILGLERFAATAGEIERILRARDRDAFAAQLPEFAAELDAALTALRQMLDSTDTADTTAPAAPADDAWQPLHDDLVAALGCNDMAALALAVRLRAAARDAATAGLAQEIQHRLEQLDFAGARQSLADFGGRADTARHELK